MQWDIKTDIDAWLEMSLPASTRSPLTIHQAMRYAVLSGGKRLRPLLSIAFAEALGLERIRVIPAASCIELIHASSLIFDDLPSMDDDDWRRSRPSCHQAFSEADAILAGCALITLTFGELANLSKKLGANCSIALVQEFASATGSLQGLVAGQASDLHAVPDQNLRALEQTHIQKTGSIFALAITVPMIIAGRSADDIERGRSIGNLLGLAYQIADDIQDAGSSHERPGYPTVAEDGMSRVQELLKKVQTELADLAGKNHPSLEQFLSSMIKKNLRQKTGDREHREFEVK